eukprot:4942377-Prorocentrum_lima.AAC.1
MKIAVINCYAPHDGRAKDDKRTFYHDLQIALNELEGYKKLVCGDCNAHGADVLEREDGEVEVEEVD